MKKGMRVVIKDNSILTIMGVPCATGTVFVVRADGSGFSFKCDQTGCMETCDLDDGVITFEDGE